MVGRSRTTGETIKKVRKSRLIRSIETQAIVALGPRLSREGESRGRELFP